MLYSLYCLRGKEYIHVSTLNDAIRKELLKYIFYDLMFRFAKSKRIQLRSEDASQNGTAANWPPYDCTLRLLNNKENLEIEFYQFFYKETTKIIYKR